MRKMKLFAMFALLVLLLSVGSGAVMAQDPPPDEPSPGAVEGWPDGLPLGPPPGYRVDEPSPGAVVHREVAQSLDGQVLASGTQYRSGWTDGWYDFYLPWKILNVGDHNSESDLVEDEINVDGFMKVTGGWVDECSRHISGTFAHCNTEKEYQKPYHFYVESHHEFHKDGYTDTYFETGKSI